VGIASRFSAPSTSLPRDGEQRAKALLERRRLKMARSAHAYVRGSAATFYEWLEGRSGRTLPSGPVIWICGDCHAGNLGPVADRNGRVEIQIRDFDQTVIGNPAHDLVRLGVSLAIAARGSDLSGVTTAKMIEQMAHEYERALNGLPPGRKPKSVRYAMKKALRRSWRTLLKERLDNTGATLPRGKHFWPLTSRERLAIDRLFSGEGVRELVTSVRFRDDDASVKVMDAAYWVKGCSSLGSLRFGVLVAVGTQSIDEGRLCLIDVKEATPASAPGRPHGAMPRHDGERVVCGARRLSPFLGDRMQTADFLGRPVVLRELLPQDLKMDLERLSAEEATTAAGFLAAVVGRAHARQMDATTRNHWRLQLQRRRPKSLAAPSWLWSSVVELVAHHEAAYLRHCRKFASRASDRRSRDTRFYLGRGGGRMSSSATSAADSARL
jgi:uncharacterized protein (DUF2252 family)